MTAAPLLLAASRAALEAGFGLALEGLGEEQILSAVERALLPGPVDLRQPAFWSRVLDRLPIDESWLFRDDSLWEWLGEEAGSLLLEAAALRGRPVRVLSLGCSGGQEAFSAAMLFQDLLGLRGIPASAAAGHLQVLGIDPSPARIEAARSGLLPGWSVQRCRAGWLKGRAAPEPGPLARYRVAPEVRAVCRFEVGNLLELARRGNAALAGFDLVLCRHVLIYFRPVQAARLASELAKGLDAGAYLALSTPEAHLVDARSLEFTRQLGVGRAPLRSGAGHPLRRARSAAARPSSNPPAAGPPPARGREAAVSAHLERALRHAKDGQGSAALREVRAALLHDPRHLYSRLLLGQQLIPLDQARGREVLRGVLDAAAQLSPDEAVPCADGLSVGQVAAAARILLARREDA
ncbi:MAG TPA: CheR family methyltransferase [Anaeromyxobacter sp.]|nr:CheR family methyltransferase [Anaeromyxobacter sp.]